VANICTSAAFPLIGNRPQVTDVCQLYPSWSWTQPAVGHTVSVGAATGYTARFVARATYCGTERYRRMVSDRRVGTGRSITAVPAAVVCTAVYTISNKQSLSLHLQSIARNMGDIRSVFCSEGLRHCAVRAEI